MPDGVSLVEDAIETLGFAREGTIAETPPSAASTVARGAGSRTVFYAASHEDYHRGQLATYARSMGLVPALTQRIHGDEAR